MGKDISIDLVAYGIMSHRMEIIERVKSWKVDIDGDKYHIWTKDIDGNEKTITCDGFSIVDRRR